MAAIFQPKDRTKREHLARVEKIIHASASDDFVILGLNDGATALGPASSSDFPRGTIFRFLGRWEDDPARGPRFKFQTFTVHQPAGKYGTVKYLTSHCDFIGDRIAARIYERFGDNAVRTLRETPEEVVTAIGIKPDVAAEASEALQRASRFEHTNIELFDIFGSRGFQGKLIQACLQKWGVKAPTVIRRNPFALLGLPSAGFKRCDRLWSDLSLPAAALKRQALASWNAIRNETNGHTWMDAPSLAARLQELIPNADPFKAFKFALRARKLKKHRDADGALWLADYSRATAEERIAAKITQLNRDNASLWPAAGVPVSTADGDRLPSEHQVERLTAATRLPVGLFLGGPGTGKSHTLGYLLREIIRQHGEASVCVCAPTGKAAVRATQALNLAGVNIKATTIHRTLMVQESGYGGDEWAFAFNAANPLPFRFIVVDESSMIDASLMASLLDACGRGTHVLFVGDPYQLPPVGHGAPLRDMIDAGAAHISQGELTEVRRNAGQIVHACARIKNGESFETADVIDLDPVPPAPPKNLKLIETRGEVHSAETLLELIPRLTKFHPVWQTQVIVARNTRGELSRKKLNEKLHAMLNPDGYAVDGNPFKVGDKIICTRNSRMHRVAPNDAIEMFSGEPREKLERDAGNYATVCVDHDDEDGGGRDGRSPREPEEVFVANGEIGRVIAVSKGLTIARFSEGEVLVKIPMGKDRGGEEEDGGSPAGDENASSGRGCNFDHAYAITVHKAQGSESPCVIVMADPGGGMICERSWWYTAISRASKLCIVVGQKAWVDKQRVRQAVVRRKTFLAELIREMGKKETQQEGQGA